MHETRWHDAYSKPVDSCNDGLAAPCDNVPVIEKVRVEGLSKTLHLLHFLDVSASCR